MDPNRRGLLTSEYWLVVFLNVIGGLVVMVFLVGMAVEDVIPHLLQGLIMIGIVACLMVVDSVYIWARTKLKEAEIREARND